MERINRLLSFLTKYNLVSILSFEEKTYNLKVFFVRLVPNVSFSELSEKLEEFLLNSSFEFSNFTDKQITLIADDLSILELHICDSITIENARGNEANIYNPQKIEYVPNNYENIVCTINKMLMSFARYFVYLQDKELITAFNYLVEADNEIIKFLSSSLLNQDYIGKLEYLFDKMSTEKIQEFKNYHALLSISKIVESSKMMVWFINDYIISLPISIASLINLDFYINIKKQILDL